MDESFEYLKQVWAIVSKPLIEISGANISIGSIIASLLIFIFFLKLSRFVEKLVARTLKDKNLGGGVSDSIARFTYYFLISIGALVALDSLGVNITSLAALGGLLMVGIGFGLQNITQNFISGLIILLERPIKKGDLVRVDDVTGRVHQIRARSTIILTRDDIAIIVPNSKFISENVINDSFSGEKIRFHLSVGVAYGSDVEKVREILLKVCSENSKVLNNPTPHILFKDFGSSSLDFEILAWTESIWTIEILKSELRFEIDKQFRLSKVEIPFPQRDLHIRTDFRHSSLSN